MTGRERFYRLTNWEQGVRHNFFLDRETGKIAIADGSGKYPDETEDGVLFIDWKRKLLREKKTFTGEWIYSIPLKSENNRQTSTIGDQVEADWLSRFGMLTQRTLGE